MNALNAASSASAIQTAVTNLGTALGSLATAITDEAEHGFTLSLSPDRNIVQPDAPEVFDLVIDEQRQRGDDLRPEVSGLPAGVTSSFSQSSVTVQPGQTLDVRGTDADLDRVVGTLVPANFTFTVVAEGATEITRSIPGCSPFATSRSWWAVSF